MKIVRSNLADYIEAFILDKLKIEHENSLVLKRNEVAEAMECAPSQVTYVLSTRFTVARGFQVESRRGAGGFVRIVRVSAQRPLQANAADNQRQEAKRQELSQLLQLLQRREVLTRRESSIVETFFRLLQDEVEPECSERLLQAFLMNLPDLK